MSTFVLTDYRLDQQAQGLPLDPAILAECCRESAERARPIIKALARTTIRLVKEETACQK